MRPSVIVYLLLGLISLLIILNYIFVSNLSTPPVFTQDFNYFIAANYYNSEESLTYSLPELSKIINHLNRGDNLYLSIFENGSNDNTKHLLRSFQQSLSVPSRFQLCESAGYGNWTSEKLLGEQHINKLYKAKPLFRYQRMAALRNAALEPLFLHPFRNSLPTKILFLNDIFYQAADILALLHTNNGDYDAACGLDFHYQFYDILVTRDIEGYWFSGYYPFTRHRKSQAAVRNGEPFRVMSCWNGAIAINAEGIIANNIKFRGRRYDGGRECECSQSECVFLCVDLVKAGLGNIFINPRVRVAYEWKYFMMHTIPGVREVVNFVQSFFFEFGEGSVYNRDYRDDEDGEGEGEVDMEVEVEGGGSLARIGCHMPPYWEPDIPREYMYLNSSVCEFTPLENEIYTKNTAWRQFESQYYELFYADLMKGCGI